MTEGEKNFPEGRTTMIPDRVLEMIKQENSLPEEERADETEKEQARLLREREGGLELHEQAALADFRKKKSRYFSQEALRHKDLMRILREKGQILGQENRDWWAVTRRSLVVTLVATELAKALNERADAGIDENMVEFAALLHDLTKRFEYSQEAKQYEAEGKGDRYDFVDGVMDGIFAKPEVLAQLRKFVADPAKIKTLAQATGMQVAKRGCNLQTMEEKIIYLADKYVKHSALVSLAERRQDVARRYTHDKVAEEYEYAGKIEEEFAAMLGIEVSQMPDFLQSVIIARIEGQEI